MIEETAAGDARAGPQAAQRQAQERAREVGRLMMADDRASRHLGIELLEIGPGRARMSLAIRPELTNGHGICHGGYIFLLSDTAFAFACNSHGQRAVAQHCTVTYVAPGRLGMRLVAEARERHRTDRSGIYDVTVTDDGGDVIAEFRGHCRSIPGTFVPGS